MIRVGLDAMGGDHAPVTEVEGALAALRDLPPTFQIQLVGQEDRIQAELARHPTPPPGRLEVVPAPEVIGPGEKPIQAIRQKRKSSIVLGLGRVAKGAADAFVSAGNTGAMLAGSTVLLGLHDGVDRATVGAMLPTVAGPVLLLDAGANVDCSPRELECFAALGSVYMRDVQRRPNPTVGLLNVGEEDEKGGAVVRAAHDLLKANAHRLNFVGNIEGRDILAGHSRLGRVDVIVCDGYVGNVVLKFYESVLHLVMHLAREGAPDMWERKEIRAAFRMLDYSQYGGSPLLGVKGVSIICHGASNSNAIKNAIGVAVHSVECRLIEHLAAEFAAPAASPPAGLA